MNYLSRNIKYLRKLNRWNQTELAAQLDIKRGSIASYESKNVEPRLSLIVKIAKLFDVRLVDLIEVDLSNMDGLHRSFRSDEVAGHSNGDTIEGLFSKISTADYNEFVKKSERMQKMVDGFQIFYKMKLQNYKNGTDKPNGIIGDLENFIILLEQISTTNRHLLQPPSSSSNNPADRNVSLEEETYKKDY